MIRHFFEMELFYEGTHISSISISRAAGLAHGQSADLTFSTDVSDDARDYFNAVYVEVEAWADNPEIKLLGMCYYYLYSGVPDGNFKEQLIDGLVKTELSKAMKYDIPGHVVAEAAARTRYYFNTQVDEVVEKGHTYDDVYCLLGMSGPSGQCATSFIDSLS